MLMAREMHEGVDKFVEQVKLALVSADPRRYLPMITGVTPTEEDDEISGLGSYDLSDEEWQFTEDMTPEQALEVLSSMNAETTFTASLTEM